jgi:hypothetical protein
LTYFSLRQDGVREVRWVSLSDRGSDHKLLETDILIYPVAWSPNGLEIIVWKQGPRWTVHAVSIDGRLDTRIGTEHREGSDKAHFVKLEAGFELYSSSLHPGNVSVFADGEEISEVHLLHVSEILDSFLMARLGS